MRAQFYHPLQNWEVDLNQGTDLSLGIGPEPGVNAFHLPYASFSPFCMGSFIGAVEAGGPCNCEGIQLYPHGNGTHTECAGHITRERISIAATLQHFQMPAQLISCWPELQPNGDKLIKAAALPPIDARVEAVIFRTLPTDESRKTAHYSGTNPCYFEPEVVLHLKQQGILHLLTDLPSVDREEDGGALEAHHVFFLEEGQVRPGVTITELIYVPETVKDGIYWLNLMVPAISSDAAPSRPVIYPAQPA